MGEFNLPEKDDAPWLDCMDGFKETQAALDIAKEGIQLYREALKSMTDQAYPDEMFDEAARREDENKAIVAKVSEEDYQKVMEAIEENRPFYRFFVVDYFATGEGMSFWLKICRNYEPYDGVDRELQSFKEFVGESFFFPGIEEPTEEEFRTKYANLIPDYVSKMLDKRDQPGFIWETHYHFNYS